MSSPFYKDKGLPEGLQKELGKDWVKPEVKATYGPDQRTLERWWQILDSNNASKEDLLDIRDEIYSYIKG